MEYLHDFYIRSRNFGLRCTFHIREFPTIRGPKIDTKIVGLFLQGLPKRGPRCFFEAAIWVLGPLVNWESRQVPGPRALAADRPRHATCEARPCQKVIGLIGAPKIVEHYVM